MEYVRRIIQFFIQLFIALFIFGISIIPASFVYRKNLKKSVKVHRRTPVDLSSDTLHDILAFFDRKCLCRLQLVNSRFNQIIQREFSSKPYLLFKTLFFTNRNCYVYVYGRDRYHVDDQKVADQILAAKFIHFDFASMICNDRATLTHFLSTNSHLMRTFSLGLSEKVKLTKFYARRLAKCKNFDSITFHGTVTLLPELLSGNFRHLEVSDDLFTTADSASVPWPKILDFLFRPGGTRNHYLFISIKTRKDLPNEADYLAFTNAAKQRFLAAKSPVFFIFTWLTYCSSSVTYTENDIKNTHTKQYLKQAKVLCKGNSQLDMWTF